MSEAPPFPLAQTFELQSRPGSQRTIYLDFDGRAISGTIWNDEFDEPPYTAAPFDLDGVAGFGAEELTVIQSIWQRVAEDYAVFDVNVATKDLGTAAMTRPNAADQVYGTSAVITEGPIFHCGSCVGIVVPGRGRPVRLGPHRPTDPPPVLPARLRVLGLRQHHRPDRGQDARRDHLPRGRPQLRPRPRRGPRRGVLRGYGVWAPIMGDSDRRPVSQWSKGEHVGAVTSPSQALADDFAVIGGNGAPLRADDHSSAFASGTVLAVDDLSADGVIESDADVDWFAVNVPTGQLTFTV